MQFKFYYLTIIVITNGVKPSITNYWYSGLEDKTLKKFVRYLNFKHDMKETVLILSKI